MEEFNQDVDIDLSPFPKDLYKLKLVKDHMRHFSSERYRNIISSYRAEDKTWRGSFIIRDIFFPIWILLVLIPEEEERSLTIEKLVVTSGNPNKGTTEELHQLAGKGSLIIKSLTVVCLSTSLAKITNLKKKIKEIGNITLEYVKLKVIIEETYDYSNFLEELYAASDASDELKVIREKWNGKRITIDADIMKEIYDRLEEDDLAGEVPLLINDNPHKMFGYPKDVLTASQDDIPTNRILIATLGYGTSKLNYTDPRMKGFNCIIDRKNFTNHTAPVYDDNHFQISFQDYTNKSKFVICQTTYCDGTIANGATSKANQWLREKWKETWNKDYDNLLVLIPYGGQYMEDEMILIHKATDEGIIIVCAAGGRGGGVVFPAALGIVLSVGVADNGPKGREVDIHVFKEKLWPHHDYPLDCGGAAGTITRLLATLLSRINHVLDSSLTDPLNQALAEAIRDTPGHLHTCVIRELLVSEGNGSHDPQLGYGDGVKILNHLSSIGDGALLEKLANVLLTDDVSHSNKSTTSNTIKSIEKIDGEKRKKLFHELDGRGITVTVLDYDKEEKKEQMGKYKTSFKPFLATGEYKQHGEKCASVLHTISPEASILSANNREDDHELAFTDCIDHEPPIDVISYSLSNPSFCNDMCRVVNEAVVAGKIIVFAAGNTGRKARNTVDYPGRIGNILVVGGGDEFHNRIGFSAVGREMDFLAEGKIGTYTGTSFAAPVVAGYIALLLQFIKENMNTDQDKIRAWSKNEEGAYEWRDIPAFDAAHNVYAMRTLLKLLVPKPQDHTETEGFGCLDFSTLFPCYLIENSYELVTGSAKTKIHKTLQKFYKHM